MAGEALEILENWPVTRLMTGAAMSFAYCVNFLFTTVRKRYIGSTDWLSGLIGF